MSDKLKKKKSKLFKITAVLIIIAGTIALSMFLSSRMYNINIKGSSMKPALHNGDKCIFLKYDYIINTPKRGDIILLTEAMHKGYIVKRIIGMPGDEIEIREGTIYLNSTELKEDYLYEPMTKEEFTQNFTVPEDSVFVMGDNRNESFDCRFWETTYIPYDNIVGKLIYTK